MSARRYASSVFCVPLRPTHAFQFVVITKRSAAASNKIRTGIKPRSFRDGGLISSPRALEGTATGSIFGDLAVSPIAFSPLWLSLLFADRLLKFSPCRPVTEDRLLVLVIGFG